MRQSLVKVGWWLMEEDGVLHTVRQKNKNSNLFLLNLQYQMTILLWV